MSFLSVMLHWSFWQEEAKLQVRHSTSHKVQFLHVMASTIPGIDTIPY